MQYYSRRRSSITASSSPDTSPQPSIFPSASTSSPLNITSSQQSLISSHGNATVDALLERSKIILSDWEIKTKSRVRTDVYREMKKATCSTSSPTLETGPGTAYYRGLEEQVKLVAVVEPAIPQEPFEVEKAGKMERGSWATSVGDAPVANGKEMDEMRRRMELLAINSSFAPPVVIRPIQGAHGELPAIPAASTPEPAGNTAVEVSAPAAAPKKWKPKPKIHDWFCSSHAASTSTLDPYKCTRCTKRRAASKSALKGDGRVRPHDTSGRTRSGRENGRAG